MKIIIIGAGQVGSSVAESLLSEENDITVVDQDEDVLSDLQNRLDLRTIAGNGVHPSILVQAGAQDADLLVAVTQSDQSNLAACKVAQSIFNIPTRIARLRAHDFLEDERLLSKEVFAVDFALCPERIITDYIVRLVQFPEALQVLDFVGGRVSLVAVRAVRDGLVVGKPLKTLREHLPLGMDARIVAIYRNNHPIMPEGETQIQPGDEVFVLAAAEHIRPVMREMRRMMQPVRRIMIVGGGNIGMRAAAALEREYEVKVLENRTAQAEFIADYLKNSLVLEGSGTDEELLEQENIGEMDLFLALTNDDENNIMAASLAKRMGCKRAVALINRHAYADMAQGGPVDICISPAYVSIGVLLARIRRGDVAAVHSLRRGAAEALDIVAHGDPGNSKVVGKRIRDIHWPEGVTVAALVRNLTAVESLEVRDDGTVDRRLGHVEIAHGDSVIQSGDHVIIFCIKKKLVRKIEQLFQVGFHFF